MKSYPKIAFYFLTVFLFALTSPLLAVESLKAPLIDIPQWEAEPAQDMDMNMNGIKILNAVRSYEKGDNTFDAALMVTTLQMGLASFGQMNMSQGGIKIKTSEMKGFKVMHTHDSNKNEGSIMVLLGETTTNSALFTISYEGLSDEESLSILKQYDWSQMQKATHALMK